MKKLLLAIVLWLPAVVALAGSPTPTPPSNGGTGIRNNNASTITISGAHPLTVTLSGTTSLTLPTSGTLLSGTKSGSTSVFATSSGTLTPGDCVQLDASSNYVDAGTPCGSGGGGSGTVTAGSANQLTYYASNGTVVVGLTTANSGVLVTSNAGVPSISTTLPSGLALGTPASLTLTNATGLPIGAIASLGTGVATALGQTVTGSGGIVLGTSPSLTTPNLGTPSALTLTNASGLPIAGIASLGSGVGTALAAAASGSGGIVLSSGPTITNPTISGTLGGSGVVPSTALANSGATAASYGSSTAIPTFTINAKGQITAASTAVVVAPAGTLTGSTLASNVTASSLTSAAGGTFGTAAYATLGTSGATVPQNNGNNTYSGVSTFTGSLVVPMRKFTGTGNVTVSATTDYFICVAKVTGAATGVSLPAGVTGQTFLIKDCKGDAATNNITITPNSGTIDGQSTAVINANYQSLAVTYNGSEWSIN